MALPSARQMPVKSTHATQPTPGAHSCRETRSRNLCQVDLLSAGCSTHGILWSSKSTEAHPEYGCARYPASTHLLEPTSSQRDFALTPGLDLGAETCQNPLVATFEVHGGAGSLAAGFGLCRRH